MIRPAQMSVCADKGTGLFFFGAQPPRLRGGESACPWLFPPTGVVLNIA